MTTKQHIELGINMLCLGVLAACLSNGRPITTFDALYGLFGGVVIGFCMRAIIRK